MKNQIRLGGEVIVSDPCYEVPTWCQEVIKNVRPGMYDTEVIKSDEGDWGNRCAELVVLHENIKSPNWEHYSNNIGVDSGQAGVFCMTSYRKDSVARELPWLTTKGNPFGDLTTLPNFKEEGEDWYVKMCDRTLREEQWGTYDTGVVSSTGYGDGSYELQVCQMDGMIHGFRIIFIDNEMEEDYENEYEEEYD
jgi:hypothetical protein